jgi:hypothetical protein
VTGRIKATSNEVQTTRLVRKNGPADEVEDIRVVRKEQPTTDDIIEITYQRDLALEVLFQRVHIRRSPQYFVRPEELTVGRADRFCAVREPVDRNRVHRRRRADAGR